MVNSLAFFFLNKFISFERFIYSFNETCCVEYIFFDVLCVDYLLKKKYLFCVRCAINYILCSYNTIPRGKRKKKKM